MLTIKSLLEYVTKHVRDSLPKGTLEKNLCVLGREISEAASYQGPEEDLGRLMKFFSERDILRRKEIMSKQNDTLPS